MQHGLEARATIFFCKFKLAKPIIPVIISQQLIISDKSIECFINLQLLRTGWRKGCFFYAESEVENWRIGSADDEAVQEAMRERGFDKGYEAHGIL